MKEDHSRFIALLNNYGTLTSSEIRRHYNDWTDTYVRQLAKELNFEGIPVVSNEYGFWLATTPEEIDSYVMNLKSRISAISERIECLQKIKIDMITKNPQISIFEKLKEDL